MSGGEEILGGGGTHVGQVVRIGNTVHRPRTTGAALVEALLVHLERRGFDGSPRFVGVDATGRQVLTFVEGDVTVEPTWLRDDDANRRQLASVARLVRRLHEATAGFVPPPATMPRRPCPVDGTTWLHGDVHYGNLVFRNSEPVALLDWDFAMPGDALYDVVTLLLSARCPRPDLPDEFESRSESARQTLSMVLDAYGATDDQRHRATEIAAAMSDGAAHYLIELGRERAGARSAEEFDEEVVRRRFLADWWRSQAPV